ncbi:MAG: SEC-C metal-binding domain-containing protein [Bryobacteraceae bacterium]
MVHGDKELLEKLGRNDLCPCGSGRKFKKCCLRRVSIRWITQRPLLSGTNNRGGRTLLPRLLP